MRLPPTRTGRFIPEHQKTELHASLGEQVAQRLDHQRRGCGVLVERQLPQLAVQGSIEPEHHAAPVPRLFWGRPGPRAGAGGRPGVSDAAFGVSDAAFDTREPPKPLAAFLEAFSR